MLTRDVIRQCVKLRREVLVAVLLSGALCSTASAQTSSSKKRARNHLPKVTLSVSAPFAKLRCQGTSSFSSGQDYVALLINAADPDGDNLNYKFSVTGGRIDSSGERVLWLMQDAKEGRHKVTVEVSDGRGGVSSAFAYVEAACDMLYMCPQMSLTISPAAEVEEGQPLTFTLNLSRGDARVAPGFHWTISAGKIKTGQGTQVITVDTNGVGDKGLTATVEVKGYDPGCDREEAAVVKTHRKYQALRSEKTGSRWQGFGGGQPLKLLRFHRRKTKAS